MPTALRMRSSIAISPAAQGKSRVFLDAVAESTGDRDPLRGQIINLLMAGQDATAYLMTWTFSLLVRSQIFWRGCEQRSTVITLIQRGQAFQKKKELPSERPQRDCDSSDLFL